MTRLPDPRYIADAMSRIDPLFLRTDVVRSPSIDRAFKCSIHFKIEINNPIRSFKGRGACLFMSGLDVTRPMVCASVGNFGQGLAWAARNRGLEPPTIFAAKSAKASKVAAMRKLGARVVLGGKDFDEAKVRARLFAAETGGFFVEDGAHPAFAEGAGTMALELTEACDGLDAVLVPLGNGALAAGIGCWSRHAAPSTKVIAVAAERAPATGRSILNESLESTLTADTIADGVAVREPIAYAVQAASRVVDDVIFVQDGSIEAACGMLEAALEIEIEPAAALGLAAIMEDPERWAGQRLATVITGANK